jgi:hypothetical protein
VDVNAQQHYLTGIVLLNQEESAGCNLVVTEGGPRGVRKMIRLMTERSVFFIAWSVCLKSLFYSIIVCWKLIVQYDGTWVFQL